MLRTVFKLVFILNPKLSSSSRELFGGGKPSNSNCDTFKNAYESFKNNRKTSEKYLRILNGLESLKDPYECLIILKNVKKSLQISRGPLGLV